MSEKNPIQNDARRAQRERQLGERPVCVLCGCTEFDALISVKRRLLEEHHVVGRTHHPGATVPLCRNCHAVVTEQNRRVEAAMTPQPTILERLVAVLRALGSFFLLLGEALLTWADALARCVAGLDAEHPTWRTMEDAV